MLHKIRDVKEELIEKPKIARAVMKTEKAVTTPGPNLLVSLSLSRLEKIVPSAIIKEIIPAYDTGTEREGYIVGQAYPKSASGRPRLMNDM